jgi:hypothetical protein
MPGKRFRAYTKDISSLSAFEVADYCRSEIKSRAGERGNGRYRGAVFDFTVPVPYSFSFFSSRLLMFRCFGNTVQHLFIKISFRRHRSHYLVQLDKVSAPPVLIQNMMISYMVSVDDFSDCLTRH